MLKKNLDIVIIVIAAAMVFFAVTAALGQETDKDQCVDLGALVHWAQSPPNPVPITVSEIIKLTPNGRDAVRAFAWDIIADSDGADALAVITVPGVDGYFVHALDTAGCVLTIGPGPALVRWVMGQNVAVGRVTDTEKFDGLFKTEPRLEVPGTEL